MLSSPRFLSLSRQQPAFKAQTRWLVVAPVPLLIWTVAAAGLLGGCGNNDESGPPPENKPSITLTGVVATGAALGSASVAATCAAGTPIAAVTTSASNGSYSLSVTGGAFPCVLKATSSDGSTQLHSLVATSSASITAVTANITPLTELVVARLSGSEPAAFVASVTADSLASKVTSSAVANAQAAVASTLASGGLDTSSAGDFISASLVAANGNTPGNAHDQVLDALKAKLTAGGSTLSALTSAVAAQGNASSGGSGGNTPPTTASLPADLLLKPKALNCPSLASGSFWEILHAPSASAASVTWANATDLDAPSLTGKPSGDPNASFKLVDKGGCRFTMEGAPDDEIVVSPAGIVVARSFIGNDASLDPAAHGTRRLVIALPKQNIPLVDLAGTWNVVVIQPAQSPLGAYEAKGFILTVNSGGLVTELKCNDGTPSTGCGGGSGPWPTFSVNSSGGFDFTGPGATASRAWAYRAGNGDLMMVTLGTDGTLTTWTKSSALTLPAVGAESAGWNLELRVTGTSPGVLVESTSKVVSVDSSAGTLVRNSGRVGSTVTTPQTLEYNKPGQGWFFRPAATPQASDGTVASVRQAWFLPLRGMGLTAYHLPATSNSGNLSSNVVFGLFVAKQP
jgi:hypothetical protein